MGVKRSFLLFLLIMAFSACTTANMPSSTRIALLAPFEGRYREIGYDALYAARLALSDAQLQNIELLPVDDGGTEKSALSRAHAIARNHSVMAVLVAGYPATSQEVLYAFDEVPVIVIGGWGIESPPEHVFVLASQDLSDSYTVDARIPVISAALMDAPVMGGEIIALSQFPLLRDDLEGVEAVLSAPLPDEVFTRRYMANDPFAQKPGVLSVLVYDATTLLIQTMQEHKSRPEISERLKSGIFEGLSGAIVFEDGFWLDAPVFTYQYDSDGQLMLLKDE